MSTENLSTYIRAGQNIMMSAHNVTLSHQLLFIPMPSFLPESVFLGAVLEEERRDDFFDSAYRIMSRSALSPTSYPAFLSVSRTSASV